MTTPFLLISRRIAFLLAAILLVLVAVLPALQSQEVGAAQLTARKVTIDKSYSGSTATNTDVQFAFAYTINNTTNTKAGIIYQFCTTPLGTCTLPAGMSVQAATHDAQSGWPTNGTAFTAHAVSDEGECTMGTNSYMMCFERDETVATGVTGGAVTHTISNITAPTNNQTVYVRISLYTNDDFAPANQLQFNTTDEEGVVAAAFVNRLTVTARVQERLDFCVGSVDAGTNSDCTDISGTTIDIGVVESSLVCVSGGANPCENDDGRNGYAMIRTNAQSGVVVTYYAEQNSSGGGTGSLGSLRVTGADCTTIANPSTLNQCFNSTGTTQTAIVAGTEAYGMTISSVDTSNGGLTTNLTRDGEYDGDGTAGGGWAWDETGTVDQIATSPSVLDDEMLVLRFAATAALTTPTGQYSVTSTYVATPTF